ncbi:unnamed protein product, partial [Vitis vinifera]|uniref:Uncharacterized protein n=1 Tax=Vitis vinifera TaxID=29760 RepID=D7TFS3_VITVI
MNTISLLRLSSPPTLYLIKWSHLLSSGLALEHFIKKYQSTKEKLLLLPTWKIKTSDIITLNYTPTHTCISTLIPHSCTHMHMHTRTHTHQTLIVKDKISFKKMILIEVIKK